MSAVQPLKYKPFAATKLARQSDIEKLEKQIKPSIKELQAIKIRDARALFNNGFTVSQVKVALTDNHNSSLSNEILAETKRNQLEIAPKSLPPPFWAKDHAYYETLAKALRQADADRKRKERAEKLVDKTKQLEGHDGKLYAATSMFSQGFKTAEVIRALRIQFGSALSDNTLTKCRRSAEAHPGRELPLPEWFRLEYTKRQATKAKPKVKKKKFIKRGPRVGIAKRGQIVEKMFNEVKGYKQAMADMERQQNIAKEASLAKEPEATPANVQPATDELARAYQIIGQLVAKGMKL